MSNPKAASCLLYQEIQNRFIKKRKFKNDLRHNNCGTQDVQVDRTMVHGHGHIPNQLDKIMEHMPESRTPG